MRGMKPQKFILAVGRLERNLAYLYKFKGLDKRRRRWAIIHYGELRRAALKSGLTTTAAACQTMIETLRSPDQTGRGNDRRLKLRPHLEAMIGTIRRLVSWEMEQFVYFELPAQQIPLWIDAKEPFGEDVAKSFQSYEIRRNLEEASKCLALDRGSACVFHLMCALDKSLEKYCRRLQVRYKSTWDWKEILRRIFARIDRFSQRTKRQLNIREQHLSCYTHLNAVRAAWRNPTMHSRRSYTPEEALDVFSATRAFMRDLVKVI